MDEMTLLREAMPAPAPPAPEAAEAACARFEARLRARAAGAPAAGSPGGGEPARRRVAVRRLPRKRMAVRIGLGTAVAAAVAAALTVALLPSGPAREPGAAGVLPGADVLPGAVSAASARHLLLDVAAAAKGGRQAGPYWCRTAFIAQRDYIGRGNRMISVVDPKPGFQYSIMSANKFEACMENPTKHWPGGNVGGYMQPYGAWPVTQADVAAWRRDGSVTHWGSFRYYGRPPRHGGPVLWTGPKTGTDSWGSDASLPADPARLRMLFEDQVGAPGSKAVKYFRESSGENYHQQRIGSIFTMATDLLQNGAISPQVRAAIYQVLSTMPGVRVRPGIKGPDGLAGTALWFGPSQGSAYESYWFVDPATGYILGSESMTARPVDGLPAGSVLGYTVNLKLGWSATYPHQHVSSAGH
jgi:hypothetical protein